MKKHLLLAVAIIILAGCVKPQVKKAEEQAEILEVKSVVDYYALGGFTGGAGESFFVVAGNLDEAMEKTRALITGEANYHLQFTPKYRRPVFGDELVKKACANAMRHIAGKLGVKLHTIEFGPDHCHLFVGKCRRYSASELARRFKGASSRLLRHQLEDRLNDKGLENAFWSSGYFFESVGRITSDKIRYYIERQQGKHWTSQDRKTTEQKNPQSHLMDFCN